MLTGVTTREDVEAPPADQRPTAVAADADGARGALWTASRGERRAPTRRVSVIGTSGSGKTTFARRAGRRGSASSTSSSTALFWLPDWQEPPDAEFRATVEAALGVDGGWVVDGNYSARPRPIVLGRVDTVVWLDVPLRDVPLACRPPGRRAGPQPRGPVGHESRALAARSSGASRSPGG